MASHKLKQSVADRARHDRAFLKKALADPGLRSKLPSSMLPANLRQQRDTNARLATPIVPGSSMTEGALANAAQAATTTRYGPQERSLTEQQGIAQQTQRDTGSFYDQYLADLAQHAQNVTAFQQGANQALQQTAQGITGLSGAEGAALQQQANQTAVPGVAPAGNLAPMASDAAAVRQAMIGTFQAQQALQGANANTYADTQARVVGPGQKLSAQAQAAGRTRDVGKQIQSLRDEEGAFNQQFRDTRRQDEFKNVLAQQTLGANVAQDQTQAQIAAANAQTAQTRATETVRHNKTQEANAHRATTISARNAKTRQDAQGRAVYTSGPFAGKSKAAVQAMSDQQRRQLVSDYNAGKGPGAKKPKPGDPATANARDFYRKYGVKPAGTAAINRAKSDISRARTWLKKLGGPTGPNGQLLSNGQAAGKNPDGSPRPAVPKMDPLLVRVAMDIAQYGGIRPGTADRLHHSGYSVKALGLPTRGSNIPPGKI
jgi:hypothetical protein